MDDEENPSQTAHTHDKELERIKMGDNGTKRSIRGSYIFGDVQGCQIKLNTQKTRIMRQQNAAFPARNLLQAQSSDDSSREASSGMDALCEKKKTKRGSWGGGGTTVMAAGPCPDVSGRHALQMPFL